MHYNVKRPGQKDIDNNIKRDKTMSESLLAPYWRRLLAFIIDVVLAMFITLFIINKLESITFPYFYPKIAETVWNIKNNSSEDDSQKLWEDLFCTTIPLIKQRNPDLLSQELYDAVDNRDTTLLAELSTKYHLALNLSTNIGNPFSQVRLSEYNHLKNIIYARWDIFYGRFAIIFSPILGFIIYFTVLTWIMRGRTPGKFIVRIKIVRLDNTRLRIWDSFSRACGYSTDIAMFGLGFLEAIWHPKNQTIHDRIADTIVIREKPKRKSS